VKTVWVVVLSIIALVLGSCGGAVWRGTSGLLESMRLACAVTTTAESAGILTKAQVAATVDRLLKASDQKGSKSEMDQFAKELTSGCPTFASLGGGAKK
jgi:hypothetical protein